MKLLTFTLVFLFSMSNSYAKPSCKFQEYDEDALYCIKKNIKKLVKKTKSTSCILTAEKVNGDELLVTLIDTRTKEKLSFVFSEDSTYERNDNSIQLDENPYYGGLGRISTGLNFILTKNKKRIETVDLYGFMSSLSCDF